ncbi:MAG: hypothetical protein KJ025_00295 [Burkholderiales bacterium]|nr:hypothetical protein [Burkholderiales bacterium]
MHIRDLTHPPERHRAMEETGPKAVLAKRTAGGIAAHDVGAQVVRLLCPHLVAVVAREQNAIGEMLLRGLEPHLLAHAVDGQKRNLGHLERAPTVERHDDRAQAEHPCVLRPAVDFTAALAQRALAVAFGPGAIEAENLLAARVARQGGDRRGVIARRQRAEHPVAPRSRFRGEILRKPVEAPREERTVLGEAGEIAQGTRLRLAR